MNICIKKRCLSYLILTLLVAAIPSVASAIPKMDVARGSLIAEGVNGFVLHLPLVSTDVAIKVTGPIGRTIVRQTFQNDSDQWIEALYLFPLPDNAAVDRIQLSIGDRFIEGEIKEKKEASEIYAKAKTDGYKAAIVEQDRPNLFHTSVANIPPRGQIGVVIEYQQSLSWRDRSFGLRFPLAITPRFLPATQEISQLIELKSGWKMLPGERSQIMDIDGGQVSKTKISMSLSPGFEIGRLESPSHPIRIISRSEEEVKLLVGNDSGELKPRDFILNWSPISLEAPEAAFFTERHQHENFGLVMITPPEIQAESNVAREVIFVIDTSGSMDGISIENAKEALIAGINGLRRGDSFNVINFDDTATKLFRTPVSISKRNRSTAKRYVRSLDADGGTNMQSALSLALLKNKSRSHIIRQIIFITDGAVTNETALFGFINKNLGHSRLFTVGIGDAPNGFFMKEAAEVGRGTYSFVDPGVDTKITIARLFEKISRPILTNVQINGEGIFDITPQKIPDLYLDQPLVFAVKLRKPAAKILITGRLGNSEWKKTVRMTSTDVVAGVATDWAKRSIDEWRRKHLHGATPELIKKHITALGLEFQLVTQYTSLVSVDKTPSRPDKAFLQTQAIPALKPDGLRLKIKKYKEQPAYSPSPLGSPNAIVSFAQTADGYEKRLILGLSIMIMAALGFIIFIRKWRI
ncbi:MAG: hypothetical protein CFH41_00941 [Alphaproteobacteria bacterium MarineAlpha11_Bin1]|nr:MAG: hypothetical protein CFH41_00941 [Alphaproteobacteria bacterium MarineAlpha11_Bin1]